MERILLEQLHLPGFFDMEVLSPSRLHRRVRETAGHDHLQPLDTQGQNMVLSQALFQCRKELRFYHRVSETPSMPDKVRTLLSDFIHAGLTPPDLKVLAAKETSEATAAKLQDLALIWQACNDLIADKFADPSHQQQELLRRLPASHLLEEAAVWVYGFDVLTQPVMELLVRTGQLAASLTITMTMGHEKEPDHRIFSVQQRMMNDLFEMLRQVGITPTVTHLPTLPLPKDPALLYMEQHLFTRQSPPYGEAQHAIQIHQALNPRSEATQVARLLRRWHESGMPWHRMAVVTASTVPMLRNVLSSAGIPCYQGQKIPAMRHGLCRMVWHGLAVLANGWQPADVLTYARSGYAGLTRDEVFQLENYAIENGIRGKKWQAPFTRGNAEDMEPLRLRLVAPLLHLKEGFTAAKTGDESLRALYGLLAETDAYHTLLSQEEVLLDKHLDEAAVQNRQIWRLLMNLLEQVHALMGDKRLPISQLTRFVQAALSGSALSDLPATKELVMIGEIGHVLTGEVEALVVVGMQDGVLSTAMHSLLSDMERTSLGQKIHHPVGMTSLEQSALRQADFYRTLTLPSKHLVLTFSACDSAGKSLRPSGLLTDLQVLFPGLKPTSSHSTAFEEPLAPYPALQELSIQLRRMADGDQDALEAPWEDALRWLYQSPTYGDRTRQMLGGLSAHASTLPLSPAVAAKIFRHEAVSISRLEQFAGCPRSHFVERGLRPVPRGEYIFAANEKGSFYHAALKGYTSLAQQNPDWPNVDDETIDKLLDDALTPLTDQWESTALREDGLGRLLGDTYVRSIRRAVHAFTKQAKDSQFRITETELSFGSPGDKLPPVILTLSDGQRVGLRVIIDRLDSYETDDGVYLRAVDYKSSSKTLEPARVWSGQQLQLLMYLDAASHGVERGIPAGAYFLGLKEPTLKEPIP